MESVTKHNINLAKNKIFNKKNSISSKLGLVIEINSL